MDVESDAMSGTVWQAGHFIIRTETEIGNHLSRGGVDRFAARSWFGGGKSGILSLALQIPNLPLAIRWLAEDGGAGDVGLIATHAAAGVKQYEIAFLQFLGLNAAMWKRRVFS